MFVDADLGDFFPGDSTIQGPDGKDLIWFKMFMNDYIRTLKAKDAQHSILHVVSQINNSADYPLGPTLAPTSLKIQSLSATAGDGKPAAETDDRNMLVYAQVTGGKQTPPEFVQPTVSARLSRKYRIRRPHLLTGRLEQANWISSSTTSDGVVALSRSAFLEDWLLPKLAAFNTLSTWVTTEAWWKTVPQSLLLPQWSLRGHVGVRADDLASQPDLVDNRWSYSLLDGSGMKFVYTKKSEKVDEDGLWKVYMKGQHVPLSHIRDFDVTRRFRRPDEQRTYHPKQYRCGDHRLRH